MNKKLPVLGLLFICFFSACFLHNSPAGLWFYTYSEGSAAARDSLLTPASFLLLQRDGAYTRDFGGFEYGAWAEKDHQLVLTNQYGRMTVLPVLFLKTKDLQLDLGRGIHADLERLPMPVGQLTQSPFSKENNIWRIPAAEKENDQAIRKRLLNHCQFWEAYFNWALNNSIETIDVRSTPTSIRIYGNGFGLKPFEELPAVWRSYFYDEDDCRKASDILRRIFQQHTIAWPHTDNKYKFFIGAFQQMEQFLR